MRPAPFLMLIEFAPIIALFIPIIAIVMGVGIGMLSLYLHYRRRKEVFALYHQERMAAIEKGIDLPPLPDAMFGDGCGSRERSPHRRLLSGLVWSFIGITLFIALRYNIREEPVALFALLPLGIGVALLIYYFLADRKRALLLASENDSKGCPSIASESEKKTF